MYVVHCQVYPNWSSACRVTNGMGAGALPTEGKCWRVSTNISFQILLGQFLPIMYVTRTTRTFSKSGTQIFHCQLIRLTFREETDKPVEQVPSLQPTAVPTTTAHGKEGTCYTHKSTTTHTDRVPVNCEGNYCYTHKSTTTSHHNTNVTTHRQSSCDNYSIRR